MTNNCILKELDRVELEKLHTKQLINRLRAHRLSATDFDCDYCFNRDICCAVKDKNVKLLKDILPLLDL